MLRGEVWWVDFSPSVRGEMKKVRPAIIISNDISNKVMNRVQVVPTTSKISKCYPCEAYVVINNKQNKAMADQIATVSKFRLKNRIGEIMPADMAAVEHAIKVQLDL